MSGILKTHLLPTNSVHGDDFASNQMEFVDEPTETEPTLLRRRSSDAARSVSSSQSNAFEHPPDPADAVTRRSVLKTVAGYILVTEFCERLAYYGFAGSLVLFFQVFFIPHRPLIHLSVCIPFSADCPLAILLQSDDVRSCDRPSSTIRMPKPISSIPRGLVFAT